MVATNFPAQPTPFVGRSEEIAEIVRLLNDCRLLTLIGPGGIGKTRLALETAGHLTLPDGVYFVPLQPLNDHGLLVAAIAEAIDFHFVSGDEPQNQLFAFLKNKSLLLILDNFEHLLDGAELLTEMLTTAPEIKLLVTSRERLNLRPEWTFEVRGLSYPANIQTAAWENYSAIRLFAQNARRVQPNFSVMNEASSVVSICQHLEGMPLALELAAVWVRALSCAEVAKQIEHGIDLLETPARDMPKRHRNMRAVLDASWGRLSVSEQSIFAQLSVFRGGFTQDAADCVVGASLYSLSALVDQSWLRWDASKERYHVHELMRQYGAEQLETSGKGDAARDAHCLYFADFMAQREKDIKFRRQVAALDEIEADFDNVRAAWEWAVVVVDADSLWKMTEALSFYGDMRAHWAEVEGMFRRAMDALKHDPAHELTHSHVRLRYVRMVLFGTSENETDKTVQAFVEADLATVRKHNVPLEIAYALMRFADVIYYQNNNVLSMQAHEESFCLYAEAGDKFYMAHHLVHMSFPFQYMASTESMRRSRIALLDHSLRLSEEVGDVNEIAWTTFHLGREFYTIGDYVEGDRCIQQAINQHRQLGIAKGLVFCLQSSSDYAFLVGDFEKAGAMLEEARSIVIQRGMNLIEAVYGKLGFLKIVMGDYETGGNLCRQALERGFSIINLSTVWKLLGMAVIAYRDGDSRSMQHYHQMTLDYLQELPETYDRASKLWCLAPLFALNLITKGQHEAALVLLSRALNLPKRYDLPSMIWLQKWPFVSELLEHLQTTLGTAAYQSAWERGKQLDIEATTQIMPNDNLADFLENAGVRQTTAQSSLTERELEVLHLVADGLSNREIARALVLSPGTIKWYISEIYSKLHVSSRTQAVAHARTLNLLP